jgi:hypothetical protein
MRSVICKDRHVSATYFTEAKDDTNYEKINSTLDSSPNEVKYFTNPKRKALKIKNYILHLHPSK